METIFLKLLNMSISAGWLILAVILLRKVLKRAPKWIRCVLWGMVALRLICPFTPESAFSLIPSGETVTREILYSAEPVIHSGVELVNNAVNPVISGSLAPNAGDSVNPMQVVIIVAAQAWLLGMIVMSVYALVSYLRLRRKVAVSMHVTENIYLCDYVDTPFILGVFRPRIYLPSTISQKQVPYVIQHERAHLTRRDHLWKPLGYLLLIIYWFQPLVWVAYVLLCRDIELACDERVIKDLGEFEKKFYSDALLDCSVSRQLIMSCPLAFGEVGVKERVKAVLNYKRPAFWMMAAAIVSCIVVAVCFLTNPKEENNKALEPFGKTYRIETTEYTYGRELISSIMYTTDYARYSFSKDSVMMCRAGMGMDSSQSNWILLGNMEKVTLTKENFDAYFKDWDGLPGYPMDFAAEGYRKDNEGAWQLLSDEGELSYYLLQQRSGDVYLVCWYDDPIVRWMFKLAEADEASVSVAVEPGEVSGLDEARAEQQNLPGAAEDVLTETESVDTLESAIHDAIMGNAGLKIVEGVRFPCESHVILGMETLCVDAAATDGRPAGGMYLNVYLMVLEQDYCFSYPEGKPIEGLGGIGAKAVTFKLVDGKYILEECWEPRDGSYYVSDIRGKFPKDIQEDALDSEKFFLRLQMDIYDQAVQFADTDVDAVMSGLMDKILSSPKSSSNVGDYIDAHSLEYRELLYYGRHTLEYCREQLANDESMDLKRALMEAVCLEIEENITGDTWGITMSAENVTADGLELTIRQSGGAPTGSLQFGSEYKLMTLQDGVWNMVPTIIDNYGWTAEAYTIPMEDSVPIEINWTWLYGSLPAGEYRLVKELMDFRKSGDYDLKDYYIDFVIEE